MTHAVRDCLKFVVSKGSSVHEYGFHPFHDRILFFSGQVIPTSQRGWRKWATGRTILCLNNTMSKSRCKPRLTTFEQFLR